MNKLELRLKYKKDTAQGMVPMIAYAKRGKYGAVIIDQYKLDERLEVDVPADGGQHIVEFPDPVYHKWLEEKLMELLK